MTTARAPTIRPDRREFIGGSDVAALIGISPWKDPLRLYLEKVGEIEPPEEETKTQRRGKILEPAIIELYKAEREADVGPGWTVALPEGPHFVAQVDACETADEGMIPVEIKSASEFTRGQWGRDGTDEAPTYYCTQLHWQMMAMQAPRGKLVALLGADDLRVYTIERDPAIDNYLLTQAREFWERVQTKTPPPIDFNHTRALETAELMFHSPNATTIVQADDSLRTWRDVYVDAVSWIGKYEDARKTAKAHLLHQMRDAGLIDFGDGQVFERKVIKRVGYTVASTSYVEGRMKKRKPGADDAPQLEGPSNG